MKGNLTEAIDRINTMYDWMLNIGAMEKADELLIIRQCLYLVNREQTKTKILAVTLSEVECAIADDALHKNKHSQHSIWIAKLSQIRIDLINEI